MEEIFTERISGAAFLEKVGGIDSVDIKVKKNGVLYYTTQSSEYPQGYISKAAADILRAEKAKDPSSASKKTAIMMLSFANIHTDEGEVIPTLFPTPEEPESFW